MSNSIVTHYWTSNKLYFIWSFFSVHIPLFSFTGRMEKVESWKEIPNLVCSNNSGMVWTHSLKEWPINSDGEGKRKIVSYFCILHRAQVKISIDHNPKLPFSTSELSVFCWNFVAFLCSSNLLIIISSNCYWETNWIPLALSVFRPHFIRHCWNWKFMFVQCNFEWRFQPEGKILIIEGTVPNGQGVGQVSENNPVGGFLSQLAEKFKLPAIPR